MIIPILTIIVLTFICIETYVALSIALINTFQKNDFRLQAGEILNDEICGKCINAPKCTGEYLTQGCDGTGKIQGGIATISIFSWWPIKVYRPCPSYLKAGYQYRREGQTMDQVLFSEPSTKMKEKMEAIRAASSSNQNVIESKLLESRSDQLDVSDEIDSKALELLNERFKKPME
jgi:hypothetical protein